MVVVKPTDIGGISDEDATWKMVEALMHDYCRVHPKEIRDILRENTMLRQSMENEHASGKQGLRWGVRMPPGLVRLIDRTFPHFLSTKRTLHEFMRRYEGFRVCETV